VGIVCGMGQWYRRGGGKGEEEQRRGIERNAFEKEGLYHLSRGHRELVGGASPKRKERNQGDGKEIEKMYLSATSLGRKVDRRRRGIGKDSKTGTEKEGM